MPSPDLGEQRYAAARALASRIGRVGVWSLVPDRLTHAEERDFVRRVEELGYGALWVPEGGFSKEIFSHMALLLTAGERLVIASGIANIWARDWVAMQSGARTLGEAFPGRLLLGLGVSHAPAVRRRGGDYTQPYAYMQRYLEGMDKAPRNGPDPSVPVPRVLAALGPKMLRLAAEQSLGAHPYFVPVEHTRLARETMGPGPVVAVEQAVVLVADPTLARQIARHHMSRYLMLPNYANNLRRLGWSEADLANGGSDPLVDAIVAWGDEAAIQQRVHAHHAAGADHVCIQALEGEGGPSALDQLGALAPALLTRR